MEKVWGTWQCFLFGYFITCFEQEPSRAFVEQSEVFTAKKLYQPMNPYFVTIENSGYQLFEMPAMTVMNDLDENFHFWYWFVSNTIRNFSIRTNGKDVFLWFIIFEIWLILGTYCSLYIFSVSVTQSMWSLCWKVSLV